MKRLEALLAFVLLLLAAGGAANAAEMTAKNDSTTGGVPNNVGNFFIAGESAAVWLTSPCTGDLVAAQVYWRSQIGGAPVTTEDSITFFNPGTFPAPGSIMTNQGGGNAVVVGPMLTDGAMNEFRHLDPPVDLTPISIPVMASQQFGVALEFQNTNSGFPTLPSVVFDTDSCQSGLNTVEVIPGGWNDACVLGVTGDWVIRAVVSCDEIQVPAASDSAHGVLIAVLAALGALAVMSAGRRAAAAH